MLDVGANLLRGKHAFITGASRGIGLAIARRLGAAGAELHLNARDTETLEQAAETLRQTLSVQVHVHAFDVSDPEQTKSAFRSYQSHFKVLDILVNNAGIMRNAMLAMSSSEQIEQTFSTNVHGAIYCAQYASRLMARGKQGTIINIGSRIADLGHAGQSIYAASKAAMDGLTRSWAKEFAAMNIRVNAVHPGMIETDLLEAISPVQRGAVESNITLGRIGQADEVAQVVLFLASDMASYMTGQILAVDGGMQG
jgi:3-oxoacyl-[acyl-carrier protein] reductase